MQTLCNVLIRSYCVLTNLDAKLRKVKLLVTTPWTIAGQAALFMEFFRQEYWSGLPFPSPEYFPDPGIKPRSPTLQAVSLTFEPRKPNKIRM